MDFTPVLVTIFAAAVLGPIRQRRGRVFSNAPSHSTTPDSWG